MLLVYYVTHRLVLYLTRLDWTSSWWWPPNVWAMGSGCSSSQPWWDIRRMHAQLGDRCGTWASATVAAQSGGGPARRVWGHPASYPGHQRKPAKRAWSGRLIISAKGLSQGPTRVYFKRISCQSWPGQARLRCSGWLTIPKWSWSVNWNQSSTALINNVMCPRICVSFSFGPSTIRRSSLVVIIITWALKATVIVILHRRGR